MTITRKINDVEIQIKLTDDELLRAYRVQEHKWDFDSCETFYEIVYLHEDWYREIDGDTREDIIEEAAYRLRRYINKYDMDFDYAISEAFVDTIPIYIKEEDE